jgi:hypothetical protein
MLAILGARVHIRVALEIFLEATIFALDLGFFLRAGQLLLQERHAALRAARWPRARRPQP